MGRRFIEAEFKGFEDRSMRADEAEAKLATYAICVSICSATLGFLGLITISLIIWWTEAPELNGLTSVTLIFALICLAALGGLARFMVGIRHVIHHIEDNGLAPRPGRQAIDDNASTDPLDRAMGLERTG